MKATEQYFPVVLENNPKEAHELFQYYFHFEACSSEQVALNTCDPSALEGSHSTACILLSLNTVIFNLDHDSASNNNRMTLLVASI